MQKTAAWPLAGIYAALIVYASLYPFEQWRSQGVEWTAFLMAPWPKYWTGFDVWSNVLGYAPLGFIGVLALRRSARHWPAVLLTVATASLLSLGLETLQLFLPARVPSNVDWGLNTLGALSGASSTVGVGSGPTGFCQMPEAPWCCWPCGQLLCCFPHRCLSALVKFWSAVKTRWPCGYKTHHGSIGFQFAK
jgi:VanZ family protein